MNLYLNLNRVYRSCYAYLYITIVIFSFSISAVASSSYSILGVSEGASSAEIKAAYRSLAQRYHPDKNPGDISAEAKFKAVNKAYREVTRGSKPSSRSTEQESVYSWAQNNSNQAGYPDGELQDRIADFQYLKTLWRKWAAVDFQKTAKLEEFQKDLLYTKRFFEVFDYQNFLKTFKRSQNTVFLNSEDHAAKALGFQNVSSTIILGILGGSLIPKTSMINGISWIEYINIYNLRDINSNKGNVPSQNFGAYFLFDLLHTLQTQGMRSFVFSMTQELFLLMNIYPHVKAIVHGFLRETPEEFRDSIKSLLSDYAEFDMATEMSIEQATGRRVRNTRLDEVEDLIKLIPNRLSKPKKGSSKSCKIYFK